MVTKDEVLAFSAKVEADAKAFHQAIFSRNYSSYKDNYDTLSKELNAIDRRAGAGLTTWAAFSPSAWPMARRCISSPTSRPRASRSRTFRWVTHGAKSLSKALEASFRARWPRRTSSDPAFRKVFKDASEI